MAKLNLYLLSSLRFKACDELRGNMDMSEAKKLARAAIMLKIIIVANARSCDESAFPQLT